MGINKPVSDILNRIADILSIDEEGSVKFEVRAYRRAALSIDALEEDVAEIYREKGADGLMEIEGVGEGISKSIVDYIKTGKMKKYEKLKKRYPIDFENLTKIDGLGPKRVAILYKKLGIKDVNGLNRAVAAHKISSIEGFGKKSEAVILNGIERLESNKGRVLLGDAMPEAEKIIRSLIKSGYVTRAEMAGSIRRMKETVGDIDILATSKHPEKVMELFGMMEEVESVMLGGKTKTTVKLKMGINCDLRVIEDKSFGAALQYFTGNKFHNVKLRTIAIRKGLKLNEYGLFDKKGNNVVSGRDEGWIYKKLGMDPMPPEMREDRGEIDAAINGRINRLVSLEDLVGDMHTHTKESDGSNSIEEMVVAARKAGLDYIATTNHTKSLKIANGMDEARLNGYFAHVDKLNEGLDGFTVLKGAEVDILKNGDLDLGSKTLKELDCAVGSVHSYFNMDKDAMTKRVIKAMESGMIHILGHPTGRILLGREGYGLDIHKVAAAAEANGVAIEINSSPDRLDISDSNILEISDYKIMFAIDSDAHSVNHFGNLRYGVGTARRGWLGKDRILNALELNRLRKILGR